MAREATMVKKRAKPTREVSVAAVMLHARAIIEQGRTTEFLKACEDRYTMRGSREFLEFARDFARAGAPLLAERQGLNKFTTAVATKPLDDCTT